eukprot:9829000-Alexandrium_andersonii.AAC.1
MPCAGVGGSLRRAACIGVGGLLALRRLLLASACVPACCLLLCLRGPPHAPRGSCGSPPAPRGLSSSSAPHR